MSLNSLPTTVSINGKEINLFTFEQLSQQPRLKLKNRAMDLRDAVGADRLPPLTAAGSIESVTMWIMEVQCGLVKVLRSFRRALRTSASSSRQPSRPLNRTFPSRHSPGASPSAPAETCGVRAVVCCSARPSTAPT